MKTPTGRRRIIGLASGAVWLTVVSAAFATWSLIAIGTPAATGTLIGVLVTTAALIANGVMVIRAALYLPDSISPRSAKDRTIGRRFAGIAGMELGAFVVVNAVAAATRHFELIPSLNLVIVGLHFFPLASIFHVPRYNLMGLLFCGIPTVTLLSIPAQALVGHALGWYVLPSLGCGLVAVLTAGAGLREAWQSVAGLRPSFQTS